MGKIKQFSDQTIERLGYYVYLLIDPRDNQIFYVGKGQGNRVFAHAREAEQIEDAESEKIEKIKEIIDSGKEVKCYIVRHGLEEEEALRIESVLIDVLGKQNQLTNKVSGHKLNPEDDIISVEDIEMMYAAEPLTELDEDMVLAVMLNQSFSNKIDEDKLYEVTRGNWKLDEKKLDDIELVFGVYHGVIVSVYKPGKWKKASGGRRKFEQDIKKEEEMKEIRKKYIGKSLPISKCQNPVRYIYKSDINKGGN